MTPLAAKRLWVRSTYASTEFRLAMLKAVMLESAEMEAVEMLEELDREDDYPPGFRMSGQAGNVDETFRV